MRFAEILGPHRFVPVVVLDDPARADELGAAMVAGGLPVAEVTLRTPRAADVLRVLAGRGDLLVGAGTVLSPDQVDVAHDAGARFVVSPGLSEAVVRRCAELDLVVVPGVGTATEVMRALESGLTELKLFPAESLGGAATLAAYGAVFGQVRFVPTGGITAARAPDYLALPSVLAVGGSWMVPPALLAAGRWDEVAALCAAAVAPAEAAS